MDDLTSEEMLASVSGETSSEQQVESSEEIVKDVKADAPQTKEERVAELLGLDKYGNHEVEYKANGKTVRESLQEALNRASQGYNYAQLMNEFKGKEPTYQKQIEELTGKVTNLSKWEQYDKYAKENPAWNDHVQNMWNNKNQYNSADLDPNDPMTQRIAKLEQALEGISNQYGEKVSKLESIFTEQETAKQDSEFQKEIEGTKTKFGEFDFDKADENGKSVSTYVMEHMVSKRIPNFQTAFLDLYHDQVLTAREQSLREKHAKEVQKRTKQGFIESSSTPRAQRTQPLSNVGSRSWDELKDLALRDLGV